MVCIHNDACVCECEESGSELSLRHEERGKKSVKKWMKVEKWFWLLGLSWSVWNSLSLSLFPFPPSPSFPVYFTSLHPLFLIFSFYVIISQQLACFRMNDYLFPFRSLICSCLQLDAFLSRSTQGLTALLECRGVERLRCYSITSVWNSLHLRSKLHCVIWSAKVLVNIR